MTQSDGDLVAGALSGSDAAADELLARHWPLAWWTAYSILGDRTTADDVAQEAVERAFGSLARFDRSRPFRPWLARIAANQALNARRTGLRELPVADPERNGHQPAPEAAHEQRDELMTALRKLPEARRVVVALRYFGDLDTSEIAVVLDLPVGTVSSRLSRALAELRGLLEVSR